jgi:hypothetical protein
MTVEFRTRDITPMMRQALRSFGRARAAIVSGNVDEMIGQLTRGSDLLNAINRYDKPAARRASRKSAS